MLKYVAILLIDQERRAAAAQSAAGKSVYYPDVTMAIKEPSPFEKNSLRNTDRWNPWYLVAFSARPGKLYGVITAHHYLRSPLPALEEVTHGIHTYQVVITKGFQMRKLYATANQRYSEDFIWTSSFH